MSNNDDTLHSFWTGGQSVELKWPWPEWMQNLFYFYLGVEHVFLNHIFEKWSKSNDRRYVFFLEYPSLYLEKLFNFFFYIINNFFTFLFIYLGYNHFPFLFTSFLFVCSLALEQSLEIELETFTLGIWHQFLLKQMNAITQIKDVIILMMIILMKIYIMIVQICKCWVCVCVCVWVRKSERMQRVILYMSSNYSHKISSHFSQTYRNIYSSESPTCHF